jgi:hypothetical protein
VAVLAQGLDQAMDADDRVVGGAALGLSRELEVSHGLLLDLGQGIADDDVGHEDEAHGVAGVAVVPLLDGFSERPVEHPRHVADVLDPVFDEDADGEVGAGLAPGEPRIVRESGGELAEAVRLLPLLEHPPQGHAEDDVSVGRSGGVAVTQAEAHDLAADGVVKVVIHLVREWQRRREQRHLRLDDGIGRGGQVDQVLDGAGPDLLPDAPRGRPQHRLRGMQGEHQVEELGARREGRARTLLDLASPHVELDLDPMDRHPIRAAPGAGQQERDQVGGAIEVPAQPLALGALDVQPVRQVVLGLPAIGGQQSLPRGQVGERRRIGRGRPRLAPGRQVQPGDEDLLVLRLDQRRSPVVVVHDREHVPAVHRPPVGEEEPADP